LFSDRTRRSGNARQGSHQDGGYSQKVNTVRLAIRTFRRITILLCPVKRLG